MAALDQSAGGGHHAGTTKDSTVHAGTTIAACSTMCCTKRPAGSTKYGKGIVKYLVTYPWKIWSDKSRQRSWKTSFSRSATTTM